jgi:pseudaminic acid cytidylyltransferase
MFEDTVFIIPARGGSKRIPHKNIKNIGGQPMIYWPLMELVDHVPGSSILISTDDEEIKMCVEKKGLEVPFLRSNHLADDYTGVLDVVQDALNWFELHNRNVKYVVTIYATAVLISINDIIRAFNKLTSDPECDYVMAVCRFGFPIQRAIYSDSNNYVRMFNPENYSVRSQDLVPAYHDAGQFYVSRAEVVRRNGNVTDSKVAMVEINRDFVIDIDDMTDFQIAERKLQVLKKCVPSHNWSFGKEVS